GPIDRQRYLAARLIAIELCAALEPLRKLRPASFHHLGKTVENLSAQRRREPVPFCVTVSRRDDGVAQVLARGSSDVRAPERIAAARFAPRELSVHVQLVHLSYFEPLRSLGLGHSTSGAASFVGGG